MGMRRRRSIPLVIVVAVLAAACGLEGSPTPPPAGSGAPVTSGAVPGSSDLHPTLPIGFPVMAGAVRMPLPADDPGLIALWESDQIGSAAYDFYVAALPSAGYPIIGLYPGGGVALIRFRAQGEIWQVAARGAADGRVAIEVRLDRP
jgi:hypothetical protein